MKRMLTSLCGAAVAAGLGITAFAHDGKHKEGGGGKEVTVVGELIDTACFVAADGDARGTEHAECATKCMASGVPAGILPQKSKDAQAMMFLLTNPRPLAKHAAKTIKVEGTAHAGMHAMDVKKLYVQQGNKWQEVQLDDEHHKMGEEGGHDNSDGHHGKAGEDHKAGDGDHEAGGDHAEGHGDADGGTAAEPAAPAKRGARK